jgi:RimJ/RimL family protein N-acetyltransferase
MLEQKIDQPVLTTARLSLRPLRPSDAGLIELYASNSAVARMTTTLPHPLPPGATQAFLDQAAAPGRTEDVWAMDGTASGLPELLGVIGLERMENQQSEIWYWVAEPFWNGGLAREAVEGIVAANPHGARTLFGSVFQDNPASARVLTNAGFDYLGDAEAFSVARGAKTATWTYLCKLS